MMEFFAITSRETAQGTRTTTMRVLTTDEGRVTSVPCEIVEDLVEIVSQLRATEEQKGIAEGVEVAEAAPV